MQWGSARSPPKTLSSNTTSVRDKPRGWNNVPTRSLPQCVLVWVTCASTWRTFKKLWNQQILLIEPGKMARSATELLLFKLSSVIGLTPNMCGRKKHRVNALGMNQGGYIISYIYIYMCVCACVRACVRACFFLLHNLFCICIGRWAANRSKMIWLHCW